VKKSRIAALVAVAATAALFLSGCAPQSEVVSGSNLSVAWNQPFYSYNGATSYGNATANNNIIYATGSAFNYYNDVPELVKDTSFGTYEKISDSPLVVKYTLADTAKWSDGQPVTAADLMLSWVAVGGVYNDTEFDPSEYTDPDTGELNGKQPADVVYFDSGADPTNPTGLGLVTDVPEVSADGKSVTLTYSSPYVDWELAFSVGRPAHIIGKKALDATSNADGAAAVLAAIQEKDTAALAAISNFWNTGYNFTELPTDADLLVANGPYVISDFVADQYITLTANKNYQGAHKPKVEEISVRFITDPMAAVQALQNGEVQIISPQATADVANALNALDVTTLFGDEGTYEHIDLQFANGKSGTMENPKLREAFMKIIPRADIVEKLIVPLNANAQVRNSQLFLPGAAGYDESVANNGSSAYAEVDIEGAKALIAESGVTNPEVCMLFDSTNPRRANEFALIQQSGALAGFNVTDCSSEEWGGLLGTPGAYDASLFGWQSTSLGVTNSSPTFKTDGINNLNYYSNPEVDALLEQLDAEFDPAKQITLQQEIDKLLWSDFYGVTVFQFPAVTAYDQNKIANVSQSPLAPTFFWNIWEWAPVSK
jgi:peptide/nickel transport system substrate-binding protein